ncbi:MAG: Gfo/Idh/MocA family oxidoreductase [Vicinamibacterales bacterium]|jgi:predicted dehydrogenase|nr:Gfo/Idh/MocA family oxidoreductase [Vicinamibacterales bacterium]
MNESHDTKVGRREFVGLAAAATAGFTILKPSTVFGTQANSAVRLGVLGCGGRGTAVTESFLRYSNAVVTAMGDVFQDNMENSAMTLGLISGKLNKPFAGAAHMFKGLKAYEQLFASKDVDAVYIATPPYFHPEHLEAAAAAGKHVYLEKPVAVDVPGARRIMAVGEKMKGKLSLAVGFQIRYASPYVLLEKRIREGQIGAPVSGQIYYFASFINRPPFADKSADERRLRNWIHERTISGDIIVEQNIHIIDVTNWLLAGRPLKAYGRNGRAGRTDGGDCSSHYNCVFTYPRDVHVSFSSTQFGKAAWGVGMQYSGTRGVAEARYDAPVRISGETSWEFPGLGRPQAVDQQAAVTGRFSGALDDADANKQAAFIGSIQTGTLLNEAMSGTESTLAAMLGRMAAETGREVTWEELLKSTDVFDPKINFAQFA